MEVIIPTIIAGGFAGLTLGLSHWLLPTETHVIFNYAYGSFWCLTALTLLGIYMGIRWEFLLASWAIWSIAGGFVAAQHAKDWAVESKKNSLRVKESLENDYQN